ncbi:MAG: hypothetical protein QGG24_01000 [Vicinamibacterales bacterium]|jgi:hypothetical protein|nr:hypothetical protein [Acidobacteriota bacterium]MDP7293873.1 hypothetical protein [Vicinamibacterales bacterium]MDP7471843.1 hypothetical protein [Vicinamibacterales bacterium]MDP7670693.1 hypothetical protein [Vicinamibacterales bacterium]HJO39024.1 hypothetical protein [Vicinamibacterales bacterium]|tara:strand:+ start:1721 stop:2224 length:504 start_codon:yes stop_codon:yes gene_type:complete
MRLGDAVRAAWNDGMRGYYLAIVAGIGLVVSAFFPWVLIGERTLGGVPGIAGFWILALGVLAMLLATLSLITRKNSRHPLLIIGLAAFGIMFVGYRFLERAATEQAWAVAQATEIVAGRSLAEPQVALIGVGAYVGLVASAVLVLFGLTIVFKRAANPYPEPEDDDV